MVVLRGQSFSYNLSMVSAYMDGKLELENKGAAAFLWSAVNTGGVQVIGLLTSVILARLLSPADFGYIAILVFIILISNIFVDSGLSHSLIRQKKVSGVDYNSVFYFSLAIGAAFSFAIFFLSGYVAGFFNNPVLEKVLKVGSVSPLIYALMSINTTIITKTLNFKLKAKLSLFAILFSGCFSVAMALNDLGIWSLLAMHLLNPAILMLLMFVFVDWRPRLEFSGRSITRNLNFGFKLSLANLAQILYMKSYVLVIGKVFSPDQAGFFSRADSLREMPTGVLGKIIMRAAFPVLSIAQDDKRYLRSYNVQIIRYTAAISIPTMFGLAAISEPLVLMLFGDKWAPSASILFYLSFAGILYPFDLLNMNILKVQGLMTTYLCLELFKIVLLVPVLIVGLHFGMEALLMSIVVHSLLSFLVSASFSGKVVEYKFTAYIKDLASPFLLAPVMFFALQFLEGVLRFGAFGKLITLTVTGFFVMVFLYELSQNSEYQSLKSSFVDAISKV